MPVDTWEGPNRIGSQLRLATMAPKKFARTRMLELHAEGLAKQRARDAMNGEGYKKSFQKNTNLRNKKAEFETLKIQNT